VTTVRVQPTPDAACAHSTLPPATWDGARDGEPKTTRAARLARAAVVCRTCPLLQPCTTAGVRGHEIGLWGVHYRADGMPPKGYRMHHGHLTQEDT
jgi:hypothetical protein